MSCCVETCVTDSNGQDFIAVYDPQRNTTTYINYTTGVVGEPVLPVSACVGDGVIDTYATMQSAEEPFTATNGVEVEAGETYILLPDGTTWGGGNYLQKCLGGVEVPVEKGDVIWTEDGKPVEVIASATGESLPTSDFTAIPNTPTDGATITADLVNPDLCRSMNVYVVFSSVHALITTYAAGIHASALMKHFTSNDGAAFAQVAGDQIIESTHNNPAQNLRTTGQQSSITSRPQLAGVAAPGGAYSYASYIEYTRLNPLGAYAPDNGATLRLSHQIALYGRSL